MTVYTKNPQDVFDPLDGSGNPRGANMAEVRTLLVELVAAVNALEAGIPAPTRITKTTAGDVTVDNVTNVIFVNKTSGQATAINMPAIADRSGLKLLVIDLKGDAATNNITINPDGAETVNGLASLVVAVDGAWIEIEAPATGSNWAARVTSW